MERRLCARWAGASTIWLVTGASALATAAPASAHVDPNIPVAGPSLAGQSTVPQYGQALWARSASGSGRGSWWLMAAALGGALLLWAAWAGGRAVLRRHQATARGLPPTASTASAAPTPSAAWAGDAVEAELQRITHESSTDTNIDRDMRVLG